MFLDIVQIQNSAQIFFLNSFVHVFIIMSFRAVWLFFFSVEQKQRKFNDCFQCSFSYNYNEQGLKISSFKKPHKCMNHDSIQREIDWNVRIRVN